MPDWLATLLPIVLAVVCVAIVVKVRVLPHALLSYKPAPGDAQKLDKIFEGSTFQAEDGERHVYLDDPDSYTFVRAARNILRTGSPCDRIEAGQCRDTLSLAPLGTEMVYGATLHVRAIVALHRLLSWLRPGWPLSDSAFYLSLVLGVVGALVAFALGWRLGGPAGAVGASLILSLQKTVLERTLGGDNDMWNVVLPLVMMSLLIEALRRRNLVVQIAMAIAAAIVCGLHAYVWRGWVFGWTAACLALGATASWRVLRWFVHRRPPQPELARRAIGAVIILVVYMLAAWGAVVAAGARVGFLGFGDGAPSGPAVAGPPPAFANNLSFASTFGTVRELAFFKLSDAARISGGRLVFLLAVLGCLAAALPPKPRRWQLAIAAAGALAWVALILAGPTGRAVVFIAAALPVAFIVLGRLLDPPDAPDAADGIAVAIWCGAGIYASMMAERFSVLLAAPLAIAFAPMAGQIGQWLSHLPARVPASLRGPANHAASWGSLAIVALLVATGPVRVGWSVAQGRLPRMNSMWRETLENIKERSSPSAVVHAWWDYGYYVKYFAERAVTGDGGTLSAHAHHWLGRALLAPTEAEALGTLRMLDCASDALPLPGGEKGALGKLANLFGDGLRAYDTLVQMVSLDRDGARAALAAKSITGAPAEDVLASSHCDPPEAYVVVTSEQAILLGWLQVARHDVHRSRAVEIAGFKKPEDAAKKLVSVMDISHDQAVALDGAARAVLAAAERREPGSDDPVMRFVTGGKSFITDAWMPCRPAEGGKLTCRPVGQNRLVESITIDPTDAAKTRITAGGKSNGTPAEVLVLEEDSVREIKPEKPTHLEAAVLVDSRHRRVAAASTYLMHSLFVRLLFMDGQGLKHFRKIDERTSWSGERLLTYQVIW